MNTDAFFLPLEGGGRYCLLHSPGAGRNAGSIVYVHPFAEELNKSRRVAAQQARALAASGWCVLQFDLFGCGDSEGEFGSADWERWVADAVQATCWLAERSVRPPALWGLRAGCLIASQAAARLTWAPDLLLWQPVVSGNLQLQQFLRLKIVNQMLDESSGERSGTQRLREQLLGGTAIEIAGYLLSPDLARGLESAELTLPAGCRRVCWLEVSGEAKGTLSPAAQVRVEAWHKTGVEVDARAVAGPPFWQTQEIAECPALIDATCAVLDRWPV